MSSATRKTIYYSIFFLKNSFINIQHVTYLSVIICRYCGGSSGQCHCRHLSHLFLHCLQQLFHFPWCSFRPTKSYEPISWRVSFFTEIRKKPLHSVICPEVPDKSASSQFPGGQKSLRHVTAPR